MSGVERVEYMDNQRAGQLTETIQREKRIQRKYFQDQERKGNVTLREPTPPTSTMSPVDKVGLPLHVTQLREDPEQSMATTTSRNMWSAAAPGYILRDGAHLTSSSKQDFTYDQEEVEYMRSLGYMNKTHNRRRDEFVMFVEAHAKMQNLFNAAGGAGSK